MADESTPPPPGEGPDWRAPPSRYGPPQPYGPPPAKSGGKGWVVAGFVVVILCLGALTAAIISKGDSGSSNNTLPAEVPGTTTTVEHRVTVTVPTSTAEQPPATGQAPSTDTTGGVAPTTTMP